MKFKIDENFEKVLSLSPVKMDAEKASKELAAKFIEAGLLEESKFNQGQPIDYAIDGFVGAICRVLINYLGVPEISDEAYQAFLRITMLGDGDCPYCGGNMKYVETEGYETPSGDYMLPPDWHPTREIYECDWCGENAFINLQ